MFRYLFLFGAMIMLLVGCQTSEGGELQGTVVNIVDGDTFDVNIQGMGDERVRPIMVDAPEICHQHDPPECEPEPYGDEATEFATEVLLGETVYLEQDESERDQYDRLLFYVYVEEDRMFQEMLLEEGLAEVAVFEPDVRYEEEFYEIQEEAQEDGKGMWSE
ncbi:thermonuclease family protein [Salicibibacter cibi]|uniref:Thermonuclease family protein n=1 Tax=Salicibibacter cibi TaxID=2743001 RepID=A0A7T7CFP1_9BACI|nr:thermonuclease family protein [Salicibibacter cibi]QQK80357.1 thermonuclease family protein [Salicibibacter cibi]